MNSLLFKTCVLSFSIFCLRVLADTTHITEPITLSYLLDNCTYFPKMLQDTLVYPTAYEFDEMQFESDSLCEHVTYRVKEQEENAYYRSREIIKGEHIEFLYKPSAHFHINEAGAVDSFSSYVSTDSKNITEHYVRNSKYEKKSKRTRMYHYTSTVTQYVSFDSDGKIDSGYSDYSISCPRFTLDRRSDFTSVTIPSGNIQFFGIDIYNKETNRYVDGNVKIKTNSGKARISYHFNPSKKPHRVEYHVANDSSSELRMVGEALFQYEYDRLVSKSLFDVSIINQDTSREIRELTEYRYDGGLLVEQRYYDYEDTISPVLFKTIFEYDQKKRIKKEIKRTFDSLQTEVSRFETHYRYDDATDIVLKNDMVFNKHRVEHTLNKASKSVSVYNSSPQVGQYNLYTLSGKCVAQKPIPANKVVNIPCNTLSSGIYMAVVNVGSNSKKFKVTMP